MKTKFRKINFKIRKNNEKDKEWIKKFLRKRWGSEKIVSRGKVYYPSELSGFVAVKDKKYLGLVTYNVAKNE